MDKAVCFDVDADISILILSSSKALNFGTTSHEYESYQFIGVVFFDGV